MQFAGGVGEHGQTVILGFVAAIEGVEHAGIFPLLLELWFDGGGVIVGLHGWTILD